MKGPLNRSYEQFLPLPPVLDDWIARALFFRGAQAALSTLSESAKGHNNKAMMLCLDTLVTEIEDDIKMRKTQLNDLNNKKSQP